MKRQPGVCFRCDKCKNCVLTRHDFEDLKFTKAVFEADGFHCMMEGKRYDRLAYWEADVPKHCKMMLEYLILKGQDDEEMH